MIAALLADPQPHIGKVYHLTGPQSENMHFFAQEYSNGLGRTITFQDIPVEPWRDGLLERGLPVHLVNHLATMADLHRAGRYDRDVGRRAPTHGARAAQRAGFRQEECGRIHRVGKSGLMGLVAHTSLDAAVRYAAELGYEVTMVKDGTADYSDNETHAALDINIPNYASAVVTTNQIIDSISSL
ncbi:MAG TPA: isochorismatase family protein [Pyrinomonadaceae bacterium]